MTALLEFRDKVKAIYGKYEYLIVPAIKFLLALVVFSTLNSKLGYMTRLDSLAIVLVISLMCSFLPLNCMILFGAIVSLAHMYALSMEVALIGLCIYLVMFLLFFRFSPKEGIYVLLTPLLCAMKIPYVIPITAGLLCAPTAFVSVSCGVVVHYFFQVIMGNATTIGTMGDDALGKIRLIIDGIVENKAMIVVAVAFSATVIVVYLVRRMEIDYSWTIAMIAGAILNAIILFVGDLKYDINISIFAVLGGTIVALAITKIIEFFRFCVDYSRTEKVQFEDDEYYYYVKAVPKMNVTAKTKTVKKINSQHTPSHRSVVTERTGKRPNQAARNGGKSVTIGGENINNYAEESYESAGFDNPDYEGSYSDYDYSDQNYNQENYYDQGYSDESGYSGTGYSDSDDAGWGSTVGANQNYNDTDDSGSGDSDDYDSL